MRSASILRDILAASRDTADADTNDVLELADGQTDETDGGDASSTVATVKFVGGPVVARPAEGWTEATADSFCAEFFRSNSGAQKCMDVPGVDMVASRANCRDDVMVSEFITPQGMKNYSF